MDRQNIGFAFRTDLGSTTTHPLIGHLTLGKLTSLTGQSGGCNAICTVPVTQKGSNTQSVLSGSLLRITPGQKPSLEPMPSQL